MNDSLLDDINLISKGINEGITCSQLGKNITTRSYSPNVININSPGMRVTDNKSNTKKYQSSKLNTFEDKTENYDIGIRNTNINNIDTRIQKKQHKIEKKSTDTRSHTPVKTKYTDSKLKPTENRAKLEEVKSASNKVISKDVRQNNIRLGTTEKLIRSSDISSKENNEPPNMLRDTEILDNLMKDRACDSEHSNRKSFPIENSDPTALLSAIKEIVKTYTKAESSKVLHSMMELHINAQANLVKQIMYQTDDIIKELQPDSTQLRELIRQNENMKQDIMILKIRNEELKKIAEEAAKLKEENITLKLKIKELTK